MNLKKEKIIKKFRFKLSLLGKIGLCMFRSIVLTCGTLPIIQNFMSYSKHTEFST